MFFLHQVKDSEQDCISIDMMLAYGAAYRKVKKGEIIFKETQQAVVLYVVECGKVKMYNTTDDGKEFIQGIFGPGESFGEPAVLAGTSYPADAIAIEDCMLLRMTRDNLLLLLKNNHDVHFKITQMLACRLIAKTQIMQSLVHHSPEYRIANLLKLYKKKEGCPENQTLRVHLTRQEIADMTGLRVETVIRTMKQMEGKGQLQIISRKVLI